MYNYGNSCYIAYNTFVGRHKVGKSGGAYYNFYYKGASKTYVFD